MNMKVDDFSLDDKHAEITENDIPDILERFHNMDKEKNRERKEHTFFVSKEKITKMTMTFLSINIKK